VAWVLRMGEEKSINWWRCGSMVKQQYNGPLLSFVNWFLKCATDMEQL